MRAIGSRIFAFSGDSEPAWFECTGARALSRVQEVPRVARLWFGARFGARGRRVVVVVGGQAVGREDEPRLAARLPVAAERARR